MGTKTKQIWANLATNDLDQTTKFYTELGFKVNGSQNQDLTSFSFGENGFIINFFLKEILRKNTKTEITDIKSGNEVAFSLSAKSKKN